jgi:hypothetical protein
MLKLARHPGNDAEALAGLLDRRQHPSRQVTSERSTRGDGRRFPCVLGRLDRSQQHPQASDRDQEAHHAPGHGLGGEPTITRRCFARAALEPVPSNTWAAEPPGSGRGLVTRQKFLIRNSPRPTGSAGEDQRFRWSGTDLWARLDLNQRPHPYQGSRASAVRTAVSPGRGRASGAKGCVLSDLVSSDAGRLVLQP